MSPASETLPHSRINRYLTNYELPLLVSPTRAARELAVGRRIVYEWIRSGALPAVRVTPRRRLAIRRADLLDFIEKLPEIGEET